MWAPLTFLDNLRACLSSGRGLIRERFQAGRRDRNRALRVEEMRGQRCGQRRVGIYEIERGIDNLVIGAEIF